MLRKVIHWCIPSKCLSCQQILAPNKAICEQCLHDLPLFHDDMANLLSRPDINRDFSLQYCHGLMACGWYEGHLRSLLKGYKFQHKSVYKVALQQIIARQLEYFFIESAFRPDVVCAVPLHTARLTGRGFNQVHQTWLPSFSQFATPQPILHRHHHTQAQSTLSLKQREKNLKNAFQCCPSVLGKQVAIVDDIITSGATINAAAHACLKAGALQVWAFTTALTPLYR